MKTQILAISITLLLVATSLTGCSKAPRINPGHLEVSENVTTHSARITNIIQLSEKEAPVGKVFLGALAGAIVGDALTNKESDLAQDIATDIGGEIGESIVLDKYGKTIYRLTLVLNNGSIKQIHVRGGAYVVGRHAKVTINKKTGAITSLVALNS